MLFAVTYDIVTMESAENGDVAERGFVSRGSVLREAVEALRDVPRYNGYVESSDYPVTAPRWLTAYGADDETGASVARAIHFPAGVTPSSRRRVARLLGCYGLTDDTGFNPIH